MPQLSAIQYIELISSILCIYGVWLNARPSILGWPIGIVSVVLAAFVYFESRLFAEFGLQIFYALSGFYGWWKWWREKERVHSLTINRIETKTMLLSLFSGMFLTVLIGYILKTNTTADWPWIDSGLAAFSLVCQIWMARKFLENWSLWMIINLISIGLYAVKGLWFFMGLYVILFILAILGHIQWKRKWILQS